MKALLLFTASSCAYSALAQERIPVGEVRKLTPEKSGPGTLIRIHGVVTAFSGWKRSFFLQDPTGAISVDRLETTPVEVGDEVDVSGRVQPGLFAPIVVSEHIELVRTATLPAARSVSYHELATGSLDSTRVSVTGVVRSAKIEPVWGRDILRLELQTEGGPIAIHVLSFGDQDTEKLVDSEVRITGVAGTIFNDNQQLVGLRLFVPKLSDVEVVALALDPRNIRVSPIAKLLRFGQDGAPAHRVRITATVTYDPPENVLYLQDQSSAIRIFDGRGQVLMPGTRVSVLGFVSLSDRMPTLVNTTITTLGQAAEPQPVSIDASQVIAERDGFTFTPFEAKLVKMPGTVIERLGSSRGQIWTLRSGSKTFQVLAENPASGGLGFEPGTQVVVTGVCTATVSTDGTPSIRILLRSPQDVHVVRASNSGFSLLFLGLLALSTAFGILVLWLLHRRISPAMSEVKDIQQAFRKRSDVLSWLACLAAVLASLDERFSTLLVGPKMGYIAPNTVLALVAGSLALVLSKRGGKGWKVLAVIPLVTGAITCLEYLTGRTWGIDGLFQSLLPSLPSLDRMAMPAAFSAALVGAAVLLVRTRHRVALGQIFAVLITVFSLFDLLTRLYGAPLNYGLAAHSVMAAPTAFCYCLLSLALLYSRPDAGIMTVISSAGPGGMSARRLLPAGLAVPVLLGWIRLQGQLAGYYDTLFGLALFALANVAFFSFLIWIGASSLEAFEEARTQAEGETRERERRLEKVFRAAGIGDFSWNAATDQITAHRMLWALYGEPGREGSGPGSWFRARQHPADVPANTQAVKDCFATGKPLDTEFRVIWPSGEIRWIACKGTVVYDEARRPVGLNGVNFDVTARKLAEAGKMQADADADHANSRLEVGLNLSQVALWTWNSETDHTVWSGPVEAIFGRSEDEVGSFMRFHRLVLPEDLPALEKKVQASLKDGSEFRAEFRIVEPGGKLRWIASRGAPLRSENRQIVGLSGVNFDITYAKQDELGLARRERELRQLADAMPQIVWTASADGTVENFNRRWYEYTGTKSVDDALAVIHADDLERYLSEWREAFLCGVLFECEVRLRRFDGAYRWHLSRAVPIRNATGAVERWFGTSTDIESYKLLEAEILDVNGELERRVEERSAQLAESERRHRLLVEDLKDCAIFMLDGDGCVRSWNERAERLKGYQAHEILGKHFSIFYPKEIVASGHPAFELEFATTHGQYAEQGWRICKDGHRFWADVLITCVRNAQGEVVGFSKITRHLSEEKKIENLLMEEREPAGPVSPPMTEEQQRSRSETERPLRVLVADDSEDSRFLIEACLSKTKYELAFVENGLDAVARRKEDSFDLVLMDMQMPLMDGLAATAAIRQWEQESGSPRIPVIALTANALLEHAARSREAGCNRHLSKPISKPALIQAVEEFRSARFTEQLAEFAAAAAIWRDRETPESAEDSNTFAVERFEPRRDEITLLERNPDEATTSGLAS